MLLGGKGLFGFLVTDRTSLKMQSLSWPKTGTSEQKFPRFVFPETEDFQSGETFLTHLFAVLLLKDETTIGVLLLIRTDGPQSCSSVSRTLLGKL